MPSQAVVLCFQHCAQFVYESATSQLQVSVQFTNASEASVLCNLSLSLHLGAICDLDLGSIAASHHESVSNNSIINSSMSGSSGCVSSLAPKHSACISARMAVPVEWVSLHSQQPVQVEIVLIGSSKSAHKADEACFSSSGAEYDNAGTCAKESKNNVFVTGLCRLEISSEVYSSGVYMCI
jgi:hypothetical protein